MNLTKIFTKREHFLKSQICTQTLAPPENHTQIVENEETNNTSPTPNTHSIYYISSIYILHHIFILSEILPVVCTEVQNLVTLKIWTFCPQKPKNAHLTNSWFAHYHWPIQIQKHPKDPNLKFILTIHFWWMLPAGDLVGLFWSHFGTFNSTSSNHLKTAI